MTGSVTNINFGGAPNKVSNNVSNNISNSLTGSVTDIYFGRALNNVSNKYFCLRFGLVNAINDYQSLKNLVVCVGNF